MEAVMRFFIVIAHGFCYILPDFLTRHLTLGQDWYEQSGIYRFKIGDHIELKHRRYFGYGICPIGTVIDHFKSSRLKKDMYVIEMTVDVGNAVNFHDHLANPKLGRGSCRHTADEKHCKWNIENHFRKISEKRFFRFCME